MKITVDAEVLHKALADSVTAKRTMKITEYVLLSTTPDDTVTVVSTDLSIQLTLKIPAEIVEPGKVCVHAKLLQTSLQGAAGQAKLVLEETSTFRVHLGRRRYSVHMLPAEDFPLDEHFKQQEINLNSEDLATAISRVEQSAGKDDVRRYLNAIRIEPNRVLASNGYLLSICKVDYDNAGFCIPIQSVKTVLSRINDETEYSVGRKGQDICRFITTDSHSELIVRLAEGIYPDVDKVIPKKRNVWTVSFDADELLGAVQRVGTFTTGFEQSFGRGVELKVNGNRLEVVAISVENACPDIGCESISCEIKGKPESIVISADYLTKALKVLRTEKVSWSGIEPKILQKLSAKKRDDIHYIMPMRGIKNS